jgi:hypothetical protein
MNSNSPFSSRIVKINFFLVPFLLFILTFVVVVVVVVGPPRDGGEKMKSAQFTKGEKIVERVG